jgi:hypothetical protein
MINTGFYWKDSNDVMHGVTTGETPHLQRLRILTLEGYINYAWVNRGPDWAGSSYQ